MRSRLRISTIRVTYRERSANSETSEDPSTMVLQLVVLRLKQVQSVELTEENGELTIELSTAHGTYQYVLHAINDNADHMIWLMVLCLVHAQAILGGEVNRVLGEKALANLQDEAKLELSPHRTKQSMQVAHWALCLALGIDPLDLAATPVDDILDAVIRVNKKRPTLGDLVAPRGCVQ